MNMSVPPQYLLLAAALLFLLGCVIIAFRPNWWKLALVVILPSVALTVWLVFGEELRALLSRL